MFNQSNYEYQIPSIYNNGFNLSDLSKYGLDLSKINFTKMMDGFNLTVLTLVRWVMVLTYQTLTLAKSLLVLTFLTLTSLR